MRKTTPHKQELDESQSRPNLKRLRAAEARYRFELLQEERMLQDHLADFWDVHPEKDWRHSEVPSARTT